MIVYADKGYRAWYLTPELGTYIACLARAGKVQWNLCYYHPVWGTMHREVSREELRKLLTDTDRRQSVKAALVNTAIKDMQSLLSVLKEGGLS